MLTGEAPVSRGTRAFLDRCRPERRIFHAVFDQRRNGDVGDAARTRVWESYLFTCITIHSLLNFALATFIISLEGFHEEVGLLQRSRSGSGSTFPRSIPLLHCCALANSDIQKIIYEVLPKPTLYDGNCVRNLTQTVGRIRNLTPPPRRPLRGWPGQGRARRRRGP